jgi:hypothetical protein
MTRDRFLGAPRARIDPGTENRGPENDSRTLCVALLALLAVTVFLPALLKREVFTLRDHFDYFQPLARLHGRRAESGGTCRCGIRTARRASRGWPIRRPAFFIRRRGLFLALPFETAYMLFLLLHLAVLGWGAYLLFARRAPPGAALVGAAALMFSGPVLSLLDVSNNFATLAWVPLVLWCALEGRWQRGGIVLALAFLGGEPFFCRAGGAAVRRRTAPAPMCWPPRCWRSDFAPCS